MAHHTVIFIRRATDVIAGVMTTDVERIEDIDYDRDTLEMVEVDLEHPVRHEQAAWTASRRDVLGNRQVQRKPQAQIDTEEAVRDEHRRRRLQEPSKIERVLTLVNELRAKSGDPPITLENL